MQREKGQLTDWNDEKGYGFISVPSSGAEVFLHIKALPPHQRRPRKGDHITYRLAGSETDKPRAAAASICGFAWSYFTLLCAFVLPSLGLFAYAVWRHWVPLQPIAIAYVVMSLITIVVYHRDKCSAMTGAWRIPEKYLHFLELCFGWPGALLAQVFFRHKLKKLSYQIVFWMIVLEHGAVWYSVKSGLLTRTIFNTVSEALIASVSAMQTERVTEADTPQPLAPVAASEPALAAQPAYEDWPQESPSGPFLSDANVRRSRVSPPPKSRRLEGDVQAVSATRGLRISLPPDMGGYGVIAPDTLISDFHCRFRAGEQVTVAIRGISMRGSHKQYDLLLVESMPPQPKNRTRRAF
jgi:uncharacterized membrane protein YsdA (DUF1294 family)/cold shock CspA family protein